jgi:hypothetical protein
MFAGDGTISMMRGGLYIILVLSVCTGYAVEGVSYTPLSGDLPQRVVRSQSPYVVAGDIYVAAGDNVIIESGVVFLFNEFTGLHVQGTLLAQGLDRLPVVFTSVNDTLYNAHSSMNPAPYDWNGIDIYEDGMGSVLEHCIVSYSVYGIDSKTEYIRIDSTCFRRNGKRNFSILGEDRMIPSDFPFSYKLTKGVSVAKEKPAIPLSPPSRPPQRSPAPRLLRVSGVLLAVGGGALGAWRTREFQKSHKRLLAYNGGDERVLKEGSAAEYDNAYTERTVDLVIMSSGYGAGLIGIVGFLISFSF